MRAPAWSYRSSGECRESRFALPKKRPPQLRWRHLEPRAWCRLRAKLRRPSSTPDIFFSPQGESLTPAAERVREFSNFPLACGEKPARMRSVYAYRVSRVG